MYKLISKIIITFFISILIISGVNADDINFEEIFTSPDPELITTYQGRDPYIFFYPFGWSKNGAFAYMTEVRSTPLPIPLTTLYEAVILDTVNNKVLWKQTITKNSETCTYLCIKSDQPASIERVWQQFLQSLKPQLLKLNIIQTESLSLNLLPFPKIGKSMTSNITKEFDESPGRYFVKQFTLTLDGKVIVSLQQRPGSLELNLQGYISNPFGDHFALILDEYRLGQHYERLGPYFQVAGINMEALLSQKE